jgi:uracil-DNA glycosylase family 4
MFTGDASGDFLYPALYRAGLASQAESRSLEDGLALNNLWITAACRCVPPGNKPLKNELANCQHWLSYDLDNLKHLKLVLALGSIAHHSYLDYLKAKGHKMVKKHYPFEHGRLHLIEAATPLLNSYHVSFQNTNTGKLTKAMFDGILAKAKTLV